MTRRILIGLSMTLAAAPAWAQAAAPAGASMPSTRDITGVIAARFSTPGRSGQPTAGVESILNASKDDSNVTIRVGAHAGDKWVVDATAVAPVAKNATKTRLDANSPAPSESSLTLSAAYVRASGATLRSTSLNSVCSSLVSRGPCSTVNTQLTAAERAAIRAAVDVSKAFTLGAKVKTGRQSFDYRTGLTGDKTAESHATPTSAMLTTGVGISGFWFVGAQIGGERTWKGSDAVDRCEVVADHPGLSTCEDIALATPVRKQGTVVSIETRFFSTKWAVAPNYEYRQSRGSKVFEVPVYFLSDDGGWTGGIMLRSTNGKGSIGLFVGAKLPEFGFK